MALGIAVAVFIGDKIMPSGSPVGPVTAEAALTNEADELADPQLESPVDDHETRAAAVRSNLAGRLGEVSRRHGLAQVVVKDAFFPSPEWIAPVKDKDVVEVKPEVDTATLKAREFVRVHKLKGAIVAAGRSIAIIDGNCVSVGQKVDGFELKSVTENIAILVCEGIEVKLDLSHATDDNSN
ncbi:MAG: hypothetical protein QGH94_15280 [Phycisphaerae bacterium]|nr:hypothetical protein [Phycisphaerae bacterium]MDP7289346.1 hypothetical protein [Phycisphaerae bacterium]